MRARNKTSLIIVSYYDPGSGFYTVIENLSLHLREDFDIHYIGVGYQGPVVKLAAWTIHPGTVKNGDFAALACKELAMSLDNGLILLINDLWVVGLYQDLLSMLKPAWRLIAYVPIDGHIQSFSLVRKCAFLDELVLYTNFGKREVEQCLQGPSVEKNDLPSLSLEVIPHGIDRLFYRFGEAEKINARREVFRDSPDWWGSFIVLNANRLSERKRLDLTLKSFQIFAKENVNAKLYLHQAHATLDEYRSIVELVQVFGLTDRVKISAPTDSPLGKQRLNVIYNACDIGINTSTGEGWGLVSFEHAATGAAQIVPGHSACKELWNEVGVILGTIKSITPHFKFDHVMEEIDVDEAAVAMYSLYSDSVYRQRVAAQCHQFAVQAELNWASISERWKEIFLRNL